MCRYLNGFCGDGWEGLTEIKGFNIRSLRIIDFQLYSDGELSIIGICNNMENRLYI